ncbi:helix-turn-helix domain-containing protein [Bradyrhizobium embrapense]
MPIETALERSGVETVTGTPDEVREKLAHLSAGQVVALTIQPSNNALAHAILDAVAGLAALVPNVIEQRHNARFQSIIEALVPDVPQPRDKLLQARMTAEARKGVLETGEWMTAAELAEIAGLCARSAQPNKWRKDGLIFAVRHRGVNYFPGYAFGPSTDYRPAKGLARVLKVFSGKKDDWGIAYWLASVNSFLGGKRPQDLLISKPDSVVAAAEDEVAHVLCR